MGQRQNLVSFVASGSWTAPPGSTRVFCRIRPGAGGGGSGASGGAGASSGSQQGGGGGDRGEGPAGRPCKPGKHVSVV